MNVNVSAIAASVVYLPVQALAPMTPSDTPISLPLSATTPEVKAASEAPRWDNAASQDQVQDASGASARPTVAVPSVAASDDKVPSRQVVVPGSDRVDVYV